jgi:steroid delta-isomerase
MASSEQIRATLAAHCAAAGAADATALADLYAPDARLHDPAGAPPVIGRIAIREHFATVLTEQGEIELLLLVVTGHHAGAVHFRATPAGRPVRDIIDTMTFDDHAVITSMQAYAD